MWPPRLCSCGNGRLARPATRSEAIVWRGPVLSEVEGTHAREIYPREYSINTCVRLNSMRPVKGEEAQPKRHHFKFRQLPGPYAIVRLPPDAPIPNWAAKDDFTSITRTTDELSIVCPADNLPAEVHSEFHWICLKLEGPFPFSLTGVLLSFVEPLSNNGVPIFSISTYDTDYILIQEEFAGVAIDTLQQAGHELRPE